MIDFKVDQDKCTKCKKCVTVCPVLIIDGKSEFPEIKIGKEESCLKCQQCLAVCPEAAISIWGKNPADSISTSASMPNPSELENLMKTRRSIRRFKKQELDKELIQHIAKVALHAPTAKNENSVQFTVVDSLSEMSALRDLAYQQISLAHANGTLPKKYIYLAHFAKVWNEKKIDVIFRDAPHLLIVSAPISGTLPTIDSTIALTYFDLLANSHGIGTLWDGFAKHVFEDIPSDLKSQVAIPESHKIVMVLLFGLPVIKYARSIQNDTAVIKTVRLQ